jgi:hypothetical protein
VQDYQEEERL